MMEAIDMAGLGRQECHIWEEAVDQLKRVALVKGLWEDGDGIVIAVSGGPDSMLLMHLLHAVASSSPYAGLRLIAAHVHHGFRQEESDAEARMVEEEAAKLGIPFEMKRVDAPDYAERHGLNPQAAARKLRYDFLREAADRHGASRIALAHHGDDQAETVLMHLIRGAGIGGLGGMPWVRTESSYAYIRPLMQLRKRDILELCVRYKITYAEDSSNLKRDYTRNRFRLDIIPLLEAENPRFAEAVNQTADMLRAEDDWMEQETLRCFHQCINHWGMGEWDDHSNRVRLEEAAGGAGSASSYEGDWLTISYKQTFHRGCIMDRNTFLKSHVALQRRLIKLILNYLLKGTDQAVDFSMIERIRQQASADTPSTWKGDIGCGLQFRREYGRLLWVQTEQEMHEGPSQPAVSGIIPSVTIVGDSLNGDIELPHMLGTMQWCMIEADQRSSGTRYSSFQTSFDADQLIWPLTVRTRKPGDRMGVKGLNGTKKVQDMFVDCKIPPSLRDAIPMIEDGLGRLIWIPGVRRSDQALVTDSTHRVLELNLRI